MTTTHDNNATTWRDLSDQLTPEQIARLTDIESRRETHCAAPRVVAEMLLECARDYITSRLVDLQFAEVPRPDGAGVGDWELHTDGSGWSRSLTWSEVAVGQMAVGVDGRQRTDWTIERGVTVYNDEGIELSSEQARELAAAILAAADALDRLA